MPKIVWRTLMGDPNRVKRAMTLVLPRWVAVALTERAAAEQRRVEDVIADLVQRALAAEKLDSATSHDREAR